MSTDNTRIQNQKTSQTEGAVSRRAMLLTGASTLAAAGVLAGTSVTSAQAQQQALTGPAGRRPNILVIFGDDIGLWNLSAYNRGMMGYRTPNIDRIAKEGAIFTDHYAQQ